MANSSRKIARKALASLLAIPLVGTGLLVSTLYDHVPVTFKASPVVCIGSLATAPAGQGIGATGMAKEIFRFQILVFVAVGESDGYTSSNADDLLDDIEAIVRGVIRANPTNAAWNRLRWAGQQSSTQAGQYTKIVPVKVAGEKYNLEVITVEMEVYDA